MTYLTESKFKKYAASFMASLLIAVQLSTVAMAVDTPPDTTPPQASENTQDSSSPAATNAPVASPTPTPTPTVGADPAKVGPQGTVGADPDKIGPQGTVGANPDKTGTQGSVGADQTNVGPGSTPPVVDPPAAPDPVTGPAQPTGAAPDWVFNTQIGKWQEADKASFTWDPKTGYWLSPKYVYDTRMGWYKVVAPLKVGETKPSYYVTAPRVISTPIGDFIEGSPEYELAKAMGIIVDPAIANSGPNSSNDATVNNSTNALVDFTNIVRLANILHSAATSGDANVSGNTDSASALSGNASVIANVVNLLNSVWHTSGGPVITFVKNIFGDFFGDLVIDVPDSSTSPATAGGGASSVTGSGPNSRNNSSLTNDNNLKVNVSNDGSIDNTIDLNAKSGNANVSGNTKAGDAITGDARVALNLINMINSAVSANGSFIGIINVFGNFNGDVLFGKNFLSQVLQSGGVAGTNTAQNGTTGPSSQNDASITNTNNLSLKTDSNTAINNNIDAHAQTGSANNGGNTNSGSATTGSADTNSSVLNLSNRTVSGDSAVLVIVNVLGHWLGGIMSLPSNVASALLGSGNSSVANNVTGPNSSNNSSVTNTNNSDTTIHDKMAINNNVKLDATSGDANVTGNTDSGNAKTGNASVLSSVANISNSVVNVRKWFGILIINVFGNWFGAVGKDTVAGNTPVAAAPLAATMGSASPTGSTTSPGAIVNSGNGTASNATATNTTVNAAASAAQPATAQMLGTAKTVATAAASTSNTQAWMFMIAGIVMMLAAALAGFERKLRARA